MSAFDRIIGYASEKRDLEQIADVLSNGEVYKALGVSSPRGLLLHGEPGVGKTLMAGAIIEESGRPVFTCRKDLPDGEFIKALKATFDEAAKNAPSIVFLDDMDKFANGDEKHCNEEAYVTVQSCIDAVKGIEVFVLATANDLDNLPDSLLRAGRFDRVIEIEAPQGEDAEKIIEHYLNGKRFVKDIDSRVIARIMSGRSCAALETVINEAGLIAGGERASEITMDHFIEACLKTLYDVPLDFFNKHEHSLPSINLSDSGSTGTQIVYHEAGHAVVSEVLCPESVTLISAYSKKGQNGGFTSYHNDMTWTPLQWQKRFIIGSLAGMATQEQKFGVLDNGNASDLDKAFEGVQELVANECVCGFPLHQTGWRSSETLHARQEQAIASEVEMYYRKAKEILALNSDFLEKLARALGEKGVLTMADIQEIKRGCRIVPVAV